MSTTPDHETRLAAEPLDEVDAVLLGGLRDLHEVLDPVPGDLLDRIKFAMSVASLEAEVAVSCATRGSSGSARPTTTGSTR